jgi:23S rRNA pseudouridine2604 synthase
MNIPYPIRINRYLALTNHATRTGADELIKKGYVTINGVKAKLGDQVQLGDTVSISSEAPKKRYVYYAYNKPMGVSTNPEPKTKDILQVTKFPVPHPNPRPNGSYGQALLPKERGNSVFPIGRLDKDSHGLILVTNDGRVTDRLLSPKYVHDKEYVVKVTPAFNDAFITKMSNGVHFDRFVSKKCTVTRKTKDTFTIILTEGKKRQIRRMSEALHHTVTDLKRVRIMNIDLDKIPLGGFREITGKELEELLKLLGLV